MEQERLRLDLQKLAYFTEGNLFTGSRKKEVETGKILRYLVRPNPEEQMLEAFLWGADVCFEKAEEKKEAKFPLTEEGLSQVQDWLYQAYEAL